jgi:biopolymer transport protein ExbD
MAIRRSKFTASVSLSSTADIAFLLLIFFMVAAVIKTDADIPLELPEASASSLREKDQLISIAKNGRLWYGNIPLTKEEIRARVRADAMITPDMQINIQAHKDLDFTYVEELLDILKEAGITKFAMVTKKEGGD